MQDETMAEGQDFQPPAEFAEHGQRQEWQASAHADEKAEAQAPQLSVVEPSRFDVASERPLDDRPLEELGLVQLAARLGASIEKHRAFRARRSAASPAAAPVIPVPAAAEHFEVAEPDDAARAIADFFGPGEAEPVRPMVPASMRTLPLDD